MIYREKTSWFGEREREITFNTQLWVLCTKHLYNGKEYLAIVGIDTSFSNLLPEYNSTHSYILSADVYMSLQEVE